MSPGRPKWSRNKASHSTGGARVGSGRKKHDIENLHRTPGNGRRSLMPIQTDFEKKKKWPGANLDKRYMFQVFLFYFFSTNAFIFFRF